MSECFAFVSSGSTFIDTVSQLGIIKATVKGNCLQRIVEMDCVLTPKEIFVMIPFRKLKFFIYVGISNDFEIKFER